MIFQRKQILYLIMLLFPFLTMAKTIATAPLLMHSYPFDNGVADVVETANVSHGSLLTQKNEVIVLPYSVKMLFK